MAEKDAQCTAEVERREATIANLRERIKTQTQQHTEAESQMKDDLHSAQVHKEGR